MSFNVVMGPRFSPGCPRSIRFGPASRLLSLEHEYDDDYGADHDRHGIGGSDEAPAVPACRGNSKQAKPVPGCCTRALLIVVAFALVGGYCHHPANDRDCEEGDGYRPVT